MDSTRNYVSRTLPRGAGAGRLWDVVLLEFEYELGRRDGTGTTSGTAARRY